MKLKFTDVRDVVGLYDGRNATFLELYKNYVLYVMDRQALLDSEGKGWMANIKSPVTFVIVTAIYSMYLDNSVAFEVYRQVKKYKSEPLDPEVMAALSEEQLERLQDDLDKEESEISNMVLDLLEYIYSTRGADKTMDEIALNAIITGTGYGGIEYIKTEETYEYADGKGGKEKYTEKEDSPNIYSITPLNFFPSWAKDGTKRNSKYDIVRKIMTKDTFDRSYSIRGVTMKGKVVEGEGETIEYKDWDMVIKNMLFNNIPGATIKKTEGWGSTYYNIGAAGGHSDIISDNSYKIGKDLYEIYEVHTDYTVQIFANGVDHGVFKRVGPRKKRPFFPIVYKSGLCGGDGMGAGYIALNYQKIIDMFLNLRIDTDKIAASQPLAISTEEKVFDGMDHLDMYPGKLLKLHDPKNGIVPINTVQPGGTANNEVELVSKMVQDALGLSGYSLGVQQKVERAAKGIVELVKGAERGMKEFVKSIGEAMSFASKYMTILSVEYMSDESMKNILGDTKLKDLSIQELIKDYTISFDLQPLKTGVDQATVEMARRFIKDVSNMTRPDGTPLFDQEAAYKLLLEKSGLPPELLLTEDEAEKYMEKQIENKYKLAEKEREYAAKYGPQQAPGEGQQMPANAVGAALGGGNGTTMTGVPQGATPTGATGLPGGIPGVQGGDGGDKLTQDINPDGNNGQ